MDKSTPALLELCDVSKRFVKPLDAAAKVANLFGAQRTAEVVHAVDRATLTINPGEVVGLVGNPVAANRHWVAWQLACIRYRPVRVTGRAKIWRN